MVKLIVGEIYRSIPNNELVEVMSISERFNKVKLRNMETQLTFGALLGTNNRYYTNNLKWIPAYGTPLYLAINGRIDE